MSPRAPSDYLVTPSGTKIAQRVDDLAELSDVPRERLEPVLEELSGEVRILRPTADGAYEVYHDALVGPILHWRAVWQERQRRRRLVSLVAIFGSAAAAFGLIAVLALVYFLDARHQRDVSRSRDLAALATTGLENPQQSLALAVRGIEAARTDQVVSALRAALGKAPLRETLRGHRDYVQFATFSPDGKLVLTASDDVLGLWSASTGKLLDLKDGHTDDVTSAGFSPDGKLLVSTSFDGTQCCGRWGAGRSWRRWAQAPLKKKALRGARGIQPRPESCWSRRTVARHAPGTCRSEGPASCSGVTSGTSAPSRSAQTASSS